MRCAMQFTVRIPTSKVKPASPAYLSKVIVNLLQVATDRLIKPHAKKVKVFKVFVLADATIEMVLWVRRVPRLD